MFNVNMLQHRGSRSSSCCLAANALAEKQIRVIVLGDEGVRSGTSVSCMDMGHLQFKSLLTVNGLTFFVGQK